MHPPKKKDFWPHTPQEIMTISWPFQRVPCYEPGPLGTAADFSKCVWRKLPCPRKNPIQAIQGIKGEIAEIQELEQLGNFGAEWNSRAPPAYGIGFGCPAVRRCSGRGERNAGVGSTGIWTFTRFWVVIQQHSSRWLMVIYLVCNVEVLCYYILYDI